MFETGVRQLRMALSMATGRRIDPRNLERLVGDAVATLNVFGSPGDDLQQLLDGPFADPEQRGAFQEQSLRRTAKRLARRSPYYRALFAQAGTDAEHLTLDGLAGIPLTTKRDLIERAGDFLAEGSTPALTTRTTGTTGRPAEVWVSRYELELWSGLAALSGLLRDEIRPSDCMQINISSRATAAMQQNMSVCRLVSARSLPLGIVDPEESLDSLLERGATLLATYPSYLAELVKAAGRRGLDPTDFLLRRIDCGGEVLSPSLSAAATETFGAPINDTFGMTEVLPVSGRVCEQGHLHHDLNMGFVEVVDADTGDPTAPGEIGSVVLTPYYPYRECMPVFRYDTRDLVRRLPEEPLGCSLSAVPATSRILGKADQVLRIDGRAVMPRALVEACEGLPGEPWPARFTARAVPEGLELMLSEDTAGRVPPDALARLIAPSSGDVPVHCRIAPRSAPVLRHVRADLLETTFTGREA
jgi:phenylacetate-coenzyme A ligase PaaK-like adenylate-forming protein